MPTFSANQKAFIRAFSVSSHIDAGVIAAWMASEQPPGDSAGDHGTQNWLNIGNTDSGSFGVNDPHWKDPTAAGTYSGQWMRGQVSVPGFGHAAPGIVAVTRAGSDPLAQIRALQHSGWAGSGYPNLVAVYNSYKAQGQAIAKGLPATPQTATFKDFGTGATPATKTPATTTKTTTTGLDKAAYGEAMNRSIAGSYIAGQTKGSDPFAVNQPKTGLEGLSAASANPLLTSGQLTTTTPNPADYQTAHTVLTKVAGTELAQHPNAKQSSTTPGDVSTNVAGTTSYKGVTVADWIAPILTYAAAHGWKGVVNSGYRSFADQKRIYDSGVRPAAVPGTSNHEGDQFPRGAVDVSDAQQLSDVLAKSPYAKALVYAGAKDPVHFSHPHNGGY